MWHSGLAVCECITVFPFTDLEASRFDYGIDVKKSLRGARNLEAQDSFGLGLHAHIVEISAVTAAQLAH